MAVGEALIAVVAPGSTCSCDAGLMANWSTIDMMNVTTTSVTNAVGPNRSS